MRIDKSHLVLETDGDTGDHVGDERSDGSQVSNMSSVTVMDMDLNQTLANRNEGNVNVLEILDQGTSWTLDGDDS